ncbi:hypothetical protein L3X38_002861 [Prunus dulcis]|uniref:Reverse transcriptase RNase H-like domain-containing protein n=1 Tax=Prunus dulcis TaxID=3755 RepID=A0AAD4WUS4_PRUDU|nr:hypothetical protein L3X38_002861 [Prunus dulcis]
MYLVVSNSIFSSALIPEELGAEHLVFYTSKALIDAKTRYPKLEKLILALIVFTRKLRPYYQAHRVIAMIDFPLRSILHSQAITFGFPVSNNEAKELSIEKLAIYSDSQLITNEASREYMAKYPRMILYLDKVQELLKAFPTFTIQQVP